MVILDGGFLKCRITSLSRDSAEFEAARPEKKLSEGLRADLSLTILGTMFFFPSIHPAYISEVSAAVYMLGISLYPCITIRSWERTGYGLSLMALRFFRAY